MSRAVWKRVRLTVLAIAVLGGAVAALLPAASSAQTGASLTGTITISGSSTGIAAATVEVERGDDDVVATTTTAANGSYSVSGLQPNTSYEVVAFASGYGTGEESVSVGVSSASKGVALSPVLFSGTITDRASGYPLDTAVVLLFDGSSEVDQTYTDANGYYTFPESDYKSGADFYVEVGGEVGADASADYTTPYYSSGSVNGASSEGAATALTPSSAGDDVAGLNIAASATEGAITGRVTDASGGVSGAVVVATEQDDLDNFSTDTSTSGSYVIPDINQSGTFTVRAQPAADGPDVTGYYSGAADADAATPVSVSDPGVTQGINLKLLTGATISGTLSNSSGSGIPGVDVRVESADGDQVGDTVQTDTGSAAGAYFITGLPAGTYYLYFDTSGTEGSDAANQVNYLSQWYGATSGAANATDESQAAAVSISAGGGAVVNQSLATGGEITGTITDAGTGDGLFAEVDFDAADDEVVTAGGDVYVPSSATTGKYTVYGVTPGTYRAEVSAGDGTYVHSTGATDQYFDDADAWFNGSSLAESEQTAGTLTVTAGATTTANAALPAAADIEGTVTAGGQPLSDVGVSLFDGDDNSLSGDEPTAITAGDGTYELANLLPGTYKVGFFTTSPGVGSGVEVALRAHARHGHIVNRVGQAGLAFQYYDNQNTLAAASSVSVTAGQNLTQINAGLVPGGEITGTVTDAASGNPLSGLSVELLDASGNLLAQTTTGDDGSYQLAGVPAGTWYVEFDASGTHDQTQFYSASQVLAGATPVSVTAGNATSGINAALQAATTPGRTTTVTTQGTTPAGAGAAPPRVSAVRLVGVATRRATLSLTLTEGRDAAKLHTIRITLPHGLGFLAEALKRDLKLSAKATVKLSAGRLTITLRRAEPTLTISLRAGAISVTKLLAREARTHKLTSVKLSLLVVSASGVRTALTATAAVPR